MNCPYEKGEGETMKLKGKVALITGSTRGIGTMVVDGGMTGYHPVGLVDLIAEMTKKKRFPEKHEILDYCD